MVPGETATASYAAVSRAEEVAAVDAGVAAGETVATAMVLPRAGEVPAPAMVPALDAGVASASRTRAALRSFAMDTALALCFGTP